MGRIVDELKRAIKNMTGVQVDGRTKGEVLADYNAKTTEIPLVISVIDANGAVSGATVTVKEGSVVGAGTAVTAGSDGSYGVKLGAYNYSVTKVGYKAAADTIDVTVDDIAAGAIDVTVVLVTSV